MSRYLFMGALVLSLARPGGAQPAPDPELAKLVKDLDKGGLSSKGDIAGVKIVKMGTAAAAAEPQVLPLLDHKSRDVRFRAVKVLAAIHPGGNQPAFKRMALKETDWDLSRALTAALTDEADLAEVVRTAPRAAREAAANRLSKSPLLVEISTAHADLQVRGDAIFALDDAAVLARLVKEDPAPEIKRWAQAATAADPQKDLTITKVSCQRAAWSQTDLFCDITVSNSGTAAYDDLYFRLRGIAAGDWRSVTRIEPGETKKIVIMGSAASYAGTALFDLVRAQRYRPVR